MLAYRKCLCVAVRIHAVVAEAACDVSSVPHERL